MKKVYIVQDELDYEGGGRPQFLFSNKDSADIWCERLIKAQEYSDTAYEVVEYLVDEITDLMDGFYRVYISKGHVIDACDSHLEEYKKEIDINENIMRCVGDNRIFIGVTAYSPEEAKEKAIKKYDEVEASGFFNQNNHPWYHMYIKNLKEGK
jgi:hypothetical protein